MKGVKASFVYFFIDVVLVNVFEYSLKIVYFNCL
jgi:hypothetical protein